MEKKLEGDSLKFDNGDKTHEAAISEQQTASQSPGETESHEVSSQEATVSVGPVPKADHIKKASEFKEEGNIYFKTKDYNKAITKYSRVLLYTRAVLPPDDKEAAMFKSGTESTASEVEQARELAATSNLNMSLCYFMLKNYQKSSEKATESLKYRKTIKALYRRAKAYEKRGDYERAIQDMTEAVRMDTSDPNDIQQEIGQLKIKQREATKKANEKFSGFLIRDEDK